MNYNSTLLRTQSILSRDSCVHGSGFTKETCGICRGFDVTPKRTRKQNEIDEKLVEEYNSRIHEFPIKSQDEWEYDEVFTVYMRIKDVYGTKLVKNTSYKTAMELQRTIGAINWCVFHLFSERTDLHRSKVMIDFRKEFALLKGGINGITCG